MPWIRPEDTRTGDQITQWRDINGSVYPNVYWVARVESDGVWARNTGLRIWRKTQQNVEAFWVERPDELRDTSPGTPVAKRAIPKYPHKCPRCNEPAYVGLFEVEHANPFNSPNCPARQK